MSNDQKRQAVRAAIGRAALSIVLRQGIVSADDVRSVVEIPPDVDPRIVGPVFLSLKNEGWLEQIGDHHTGRGIAHSRMVRDWRLKADRRRAEELVAKLAPDDATIRKERSLFDAIDDPLPGKDAAGTAATVPTAANPSVVPESTAKQTEEPTPGIVPGNGGEEHP